MRSPLSSSTTSPDADAILDAPFGRQSEVALDETVLHLDRAAHRIDDAPELDDCAVAGALDDSAVMGGDGGVDEIAARPAERASVRSSSALASRLCRQYRRPRSPLVSGSPPLRPSGRLSM
jgi:hypothetical protein